MNSRRWFNMHSTNKKLVVDPKFRNHFRNLKQVFLYITDDCNLRCVQCLYKPNIREDREIKLETALELLTTFREMGAFKLSILGGEPTRYGHTNENKPLLTVISKARDMGYEYIRLDTNGQFEGTLLGNKIFKSLDELSFSIDGHTPEINDPIRGEDSFSKCLPNLIEAVKVGYNVQITCCVHRENIGRDNEGNLLLDSMIRFATKVGVDAINFHTLFKMGVPMDAWTGEVDIDPREWMEVYKEIRGKIDAGKYKIPVRVPQRFITREEFERNPTYYCFCPAKAGERVLVHPNGIIRICSTLIGSPYGIARYDDRRIIWEEFINELWKHDLDKPTPCTNQRKDFGHDIVPLCISFKPKQKELVWKITGGEE